MLNNKILIIVLILSCQQFFLSSHCQKIQQLTPKKLQDSIQQNQFTFVYFYSASCQYCIKFTPMFEQLAKIHNISGLHFGKIDATVYKDVSDKYDVFSYPTLALFWKGIDAPIFYRKQRETAEILQFLKSKTKVLENFVTKQHLEKLTKQQRNMGIVYIGPTHTIEQNITTVLSFLQPYRPFAILNANVTEPYMQIKGELHKGFDIKQIRTQIRSAFARVFDIEQEAWVRIHESKQVGIAFIDVSGGSKSKQVVKIMNKLAKEMPDITFMRLEPSQQQYKQAIDFLEIESEDNLIAIHKKYDAKFTAPKPYTQQSIREFITQVLNLSATLYMRSQKTTHKQKLTLANFDSKINEPKDILVFLYRTDDRLQAKFMDLFKYLTKKLENNQNISLLRCNLSKNQIQMKLGYQVKVTPSIIFYQNRVKDKPVHFLNSKISAETVIQFIMENTTFDWEDEWGQL